MATTTLRTPSLELAETVGRRCGQNVCKCYQCKKCTAGCPVAGHTGMHPAQIMRAIQLGQLDLAIEDRFIWICTGCQTCTSRCPQGIDVAAVIDELRAIARRENRIPSGAPLSRVLRLNAESVRRWGRLYEMELVGRSMISCPKNLLEYLPLGQKMLLKGKVRFLPERGDRAALKRMFETSEGIMLERSNPFDTMKEACS
jgi:heterodisulfide reductase subunit C2